MPLLAGLTADEMDALVHKLKNDNTPSEARLNSMVNNNFEEKLAELS